VGFYKIKGYFYVKEKIIDSLYIVKYFSIMSKKLSTLVNKINIFFTVNQCIWKIQKKYINTNQSKREKI